MGVVYGAAPPIQLYGNGLVGIETGPRGGINTARTMTSGQLALTYFTPSQGYLATQMVVSSDSTAAGATPTICRMGVYTIAANGSGTLVAATLNDTALFAAANTEYVRSFDAGGGLPTSYAYLAGQRYAHAALVVTGATAPNVCGFSQRGAPALYARAPRLFGFIAAQTDLPTSFVVGSLTNSVVGCWIGAI